MIQHTLLRISVLGVSLNVLLVIIISWVWGYIVFQKALYPEKGSRILPSKNVERFVSRDSVDKLPSEVASKAWIF